jgi:DnaJ-class molecular chaperone
MENHYETLGVNKDATNDEIKKAYRALSFKYHPDRNKEEGAMQMFQKINAANEVLSDQMKRSAYDMQMDMGIDIEMGDMGNIFENIFGGMANMNFNMGAGGPKIHIFKGGFGPGLAGLGGEFLQSLQKPPPVIKDVYISFEQSYSGSSVTLDLETWGIVNNMKVPNQTTIQFGIPPGIYDNETICLKNMGNTVHNNIKGDVKVNIHVTDHSEFLREGDDLVYNKTLSLKEALCGFEFTVKHLNGKSYLFNNKEIVIHPNFKKFIPGLGFKRDEEIGNLIIKFTIEFPETILEETKEKLRNIL